MAGVQFTVKPTGRLANANWAEDEVLTEGAPETLGVFTRWMANFFT